MSDQDLLNESLGRLRDSLAASNPEVASILERASAGEITEVQAMGELLSVFEDNPSLIAQLMDMTSTAMAPIQDDRPTLPSGEDEAVVAGHEFFSGVGLPRLNPLYEAALIERAQFDGDVPEARIGGMLPPGVKPAIAVKTDARNPVVVGDMLIRAADGLEQEIREHDIKRLQGVSGSNDVLALMKKTSTELVEFDPDFFEAVRGSAETDHPAYRRGQVPAPLSVSPTSGAALVAMTPQERREKAWKFLSTTHGRRSAVHTIGQQVQTHLGAVLDVQHREYDAKAEVTVLALAEWSLTLSGPKSTQSSFSVIDTASRVLAQNIEKEGVDHPGPLWLEIVPINEVDIRTVGWAARVVVDA